MPRRKFSLGKSATLATVGGVVGYGTVSLGPSDARGPAYWEVTSIIVQSSRPGVAPIPKFQIYLDRIAPEASQGLTYDGSFNPGRGSVTLSRGNQLIGVWSGGQNGDLVTLTLSGERW